MGEFPSTRRRRARGLLAVACGAAAIAITAAACGSSGTSSAGGASSSTAPTGGTPVTGGTATYALPPSTVSNYIFPFTSSSDFSVSNSQYLQYLLYRPLYWFGNGEWGIALRCAQLDGNRARLVAGCGIVAGSEPAAELAETITKFRPMRAALEQSLFVAYVIVCVLFCDTIVIFR